ncbi:hypothetical protein NAP1_08602 [Erythrobacter sp. NAP1]|uniref:helix-hairpin-helix domain-containing protein n=1 Tax=Erythrobacter sp. NAP1 TaxID=237727 RepID=UPI0000685262|nr:helix-hairpin-helix domain-containing protein [Erythrobacter sp. NAP1]EAQ27639.1 hypothetical protein NAP1_08602 [Erythrobacter sp. NAP1]
MSPQYTQAAIMIAIAVVFVALAIWLWLRANRKTTIVDDGKSGKDVLDEGAERAARNHALIDAPTAVKQDFGQTSANANSDKIAAAGETADAEAGVSVAPTVGDPVPPRPDHWEAEQPADAIPTPAPAPTPAPEAEAEADDLTRIKGLGPKLRTILAEQGITRFDQIAAWSDEDIARIDAGLGRFSGRITRDQWVEQAKLLSAKDESGFTSKFGQTR